MNVISLTGTSNPSSLTLPKTSTVVNVPSTIDNNEHLSTKLNYEQTSESSQPLTIDFNDPSTTNFLLSALASGASSDSNAIVNHLVQKAQTQQQRTVTSSPDITSVNCPITSTNKNLPITSSGLKDCTETTNLLPSIHQSTVHRVSSANDLNQQTAIFNNNDDKKQHQQIFFINNKPYIIQQNMTDDQSVQQRLILTSSSSQSDGSFPKISPINSTCLLSFIS